jgi:hypothetical protein
LTGARYYFLNQTRRPNRSRLAGLDRLRLQALMVKLGRSTLGLRVGHPHYLVGDAVRLLLVNVGGFDWITLEDPTP